VLPALIRKFHEAKESGAPTATVWGSGRPRREFLYVDDLADVVCFLMERYDSPDVINVGVGDDISITELAGLVREIVGFAGRIVFDGSKPDGTPRKLLDVTRLTALGWRATTDLATGIRATYRWYLSRRSV
jgi:GDP-L-fucose synthase